MKLFQRIEHIVWIVLVKRVQRVVGLKFVDGVVVVVRSVFVNRI